MYPGCETLSCFQEILNTKNKYKTQNQIKIQKNNGLVSDENSVADESNTLHANVAGQIGYSPAVPQIGLAQKRSPV